MSFLTLRCRLAEQSQRNCKQQINRHSQNSHILDLLSRTIPKARAMPKNDPSVDSMPRFSKSPRWMNSWCRDRSIVALFEASQVNFNKRKTARSGGKLDGGNPIHQIRGSFNPNTGTCVGGHLEVEVISRIWRPHFDARRVRSGQ